VLSFTSQYLIIDLSKSFADHNPAFTTRIRGALRRLCKRHRMALSRKTCRSYGSRPIDMIRKKDMERAYAVDIPSRRSHIERKGSYITSNLDVIFSSFALEQIINKCLISIHQVIQDLRRLLSLSANPRGIACLVIDKSRCGNYCRPRLRYIFHALY